MVNNNLFAAENNIGSGNWSSLCLSVGNPAYAHQDAAGTSLIDNATYTCSRGTWLPMIHPYFGARTYGTPQDAYVNCSTIPVELTSFDGVVRNGGIDLFWETASESSCAGFYVERTIQGNDNWNTIAFISGHGNSNAIHYYNLSDTKVQYGTTYQYHLVQVDHGWHTKLSEC